MTRLALNGTLEVSQNRSHERERLRHKLGVALLKAETITASHLERLETHLLPTGAPQERVNSFLEFQMKFRSVALEQMMGLAPSGTHWLEI